MVLGEMFMAILQTEETVIETEKHRSKHHKTNGILKTMVTKIKIL